MLFFQVSLYNGAEVWWDDYGILHIDIPSAYFGKTEVSYNISVKSILFFNNNNKIPFATLL
jgi:hypothetical protein